jgi:sugar phosphate permease
LGVDIDLAQKDKALALLDGSNVNFDPNSEEAKRVLRKIDMRIMPMVFFTYTIMLMDKNTLSFAAIMGLKTDTNLSTSDYSWLGSLL